MQMCIWLPQSSMLLNCKVETLKCLKKVKVKQKRKIVANVDCLSLKITANMIAALSQLNLNTLHHIFLDTVFFSCLSLSP